LADRNSDCHQPHDFAVPLPMPLVAFRGALRVAPRGRWGDGGAVLGSAEPRPPATVGGALLENAMEWVDIATDQIGFPDGNHGVPAVHSRGPRISRGRPAWRRVALKGDRLRPLRSAQAVAVHGIGGRGHPVERCRFLPDHAKFGAVRRRHGLRPRRSGPRRFDAGCRAVRKLRGRTDPSRAFGGIKGATTRLTALAYWKFESSPLQR